MSFGNTPPNERVAGFLEGGLIAIVLPAFVGTFQRTLRTAPIQSQDSMGSALWFLNFVGTLPGLLSFVGLGIATLCGGPLAFIGYIVGIVGGDLFFTNPKLGLTLALIGGVITWIGVEVWNWRDHL